MKLMTVNGRCLKVRHLNYTYYPFDVNCYLSEPENFQGKLKKIFRNFNFVNLIKWSKSETQLTTS